jgi:hypothetical protein
MKMMSISRPASFLALATCSLAVGLAAAQANDNWPHWRGPDANGSTATGQYPVQWDPANVHWKVALPGKGSSSPIVWNERIYLTCPSAGQDAVLAYDFPASSLGNQTRAGKPAQNIARSVRAAMPRPSRMVTASSSISKAAPLPRSNSTAPSAGG